jgi:hypothetical protein
MDSWQGSDWDYAIISTVDTQGQMKMKIER